MTITKRYSAKRKPSRSRTPRTASKKLKAMARRMELVRRVTAKLREDSYVSPERRRVPFTV